MFNWVLNTPPLFKLLRENHVGRSELLANGKMTICSFDTPIFTRKSGTLYISNKKMQ